MTLFFYRVVKRVIGLSRLSLARMTRLLISTVAFTKKRSGFKSEVNVNTWPLSRLFWKRQQRLTILAFPKLRNDYFASIRLFSFGEEDDVIDGESRGSIIDVCLENFICDRWVWSCAHSLIRKPTCVPRINQFAMAV